MIARSQSATLWTLGTPRTSIMGSFARSIDVDVLATIGVRLMIIAGGFVSSIVTARCLSPTGRGEYFLVVTLAQTLAQFGNFGLPSSNTYLVARDRRIAGPLVANSLWLAVASGGLGSLIVIAALRIAGASGGGLFWFAIFLAPATLFYLLATNLLVGLKRMGAFNVFQLVSNGGVVICLLGAAIVGAGPAGFLGASVAAWTIVSVALLLVLRRDVSASLRFDTAAFREGFRYALKAYVATLCGFLVARSNVFLLGMLKTPAQVGYYSVAGQIADVIGILPQSMALVLFPTLITATENRFRVTLGQVALVGLLLGVGCGTIGLVAEPFVRVVFGEKFTESVAVLRWMLPGAFCLGLTSVLSQYLAASGFPKSLVVVWMSGAAVAIGLGWYLIPRASAVGAAMALSMTQAAIFVAVLALSLAHARGVVAGRLAVATQQGALS